MRPRLLSDVAELAAQVTGLASLWLGFIANGHFATLVRINVSAGSRAVAIFRDTLLVEMVHERTALGGKTLDVDGEFNAISVFAGGSMDFSDEAAFALDVGNVQGAPRVACGKGSRSDGGGLGANSGSQGKGGEETMLHE